MMGNIDSVPSNVQSSHQVYSMDFLPIPEYVIKKGRPHGHRYGKKPGDREYYLANQLQKKCKKKKFQGIHDRFLRDHVFRERMIQHNRDQEVCRAWDDLAEQDHTYRMSEAEYVHYRQNWWISLNKSGNTTEPIRKCSHFNQALSTMEIGIEFFFFLVAMKRILVVFLRIPRKSRKRRQAKVCDRTEQPVVYRTLAKNSDKWLL